MENKYIADTKQVDASYWPYWVILVTGRTISHILQCFFWFSLHLVFCIYALLILGQRYVILPCYFKDKQVCAYNCFHWKIIFNDMNFPNVLYIYFANFHRSVNLLGDPYFENEKSKKKKHPFFSLLGTLIYFEVYTLRVFPYEEVRGCADYNGGFISLKVTIKEGHTRFFYKQLRILVSTQVAYFFAKKWYWNCLFFAKKGLLLISQKQEKVSTGITYFFGKIEYCCL